MIAEYNSAFHIEEPTQDAADTRQENPPEDEVEEIEEVVAAASENAAYIAEAGTAEVETFDLKNETLDEVNEPNELDSDSETPVGQVTEK